MYTRDIMMHIRHIMSRYIPCSSILDVLSKRHFQFRFFPPPIVMFISVNCTSTGFPSNFCSRYAIRGPRCVCVCVCVCVCEREREREGVCVGACIHVYMCGGWTCAWVRACMDVCMCVCVCVCVMGREG